ncbi:MAG: biopolymer transporter ExbD, partial [Opitutaceae bacterium]
MARTFRRPRQSHPIAELNVTNLIDLGFTLLIIFMITTQATQEQTIPVNLPSESKSVQQNVDKNAHFVAIS